MPPKTKVTKEEILSAAMNMVRESGESVLNARALAARLGCSTQPVFSNYATMEALREDVLRRAYEMYLSYLKTDMTGGKYPPYKASGMAYIRFALEEPELFKLLFMRDRPRAEQGQMGSDFEQIVDIVQEKLGLDRARAVRFHLEMWVYVHGIAVMLATNYLQLDWNTISEMMTDAYESMRAHYMKEGEK